MGMTMAPTNDTTQRLISRLYGLGVGLEEKPPQAAVLLRVDPNPATLFTQVTWSEPLTKGELVLNDALG